MWTIVGAVALGILVGCSDILPKKIYNSTNKITIVGLVVLLFSMGLGIGSNGEILSNLDKLGLKAFLLATGSITGSVFLVWFLQKSIFRSDNR